MSIKMLFFQFVYRQHIYSEIISGCYFRWFLNKTKWIHVRKMQSVHEIV